MGTLIAMAYPTGMFAKQADHTYVECGTGGAAWSCWGGKTGGNELRRGQGSTKRADEIAQPKERAGITCYLINGVCHQAANRILLPASITVRGARGYSVSEALFGTYGKVGRWPCRAPFDQYPSVTGDLAACVDATDGDAEVRASAAGAPAGADKLESQYIQGVLDIYSQAATMMSAESADAGEAQDFSVKLFMYMAEYHLGGMPDKTLSKNLTDVRVDTETTRAKPEAAFANKEMSAQEFVDDFNEMTIAFQDKMASIMNPEQYQTIFDLKPDERVVLADPEIVKKVFGIE